MTLAHPLPCLKWSNLDGFACMFFARGRHTAETAHRAERLARAARVQRMASPAQSCQLTGSCELRLSPTSPRHQAAAAKFQMVHPRSGDCKGASRWRVIVIRGLGPAAETSTALLCSFGSLSQINQPPMER